MTIVPDFYTGKCPLIEMAMMYGFEVKAYFDQFYHNLFMVKKMIMKGFFRVISTSK